MGFKKNLSKEAANVVFGDSQKDEIYASQSSFDDPEACTAAFEESVRKLFDVNSWTHLPGISSGFQLYDKFGNIKNTARPEVGDYLRISLSGSIPENWVMIINKKIEENLAELTVRPCPKPQSPEKVETEHFFVDEATSTFKVEKLGNMILAKSIEKNEGMNSEKAGNSRLINALTAEGGWAGFREVKWKKLTDYLVHDLELEK